MANIASSSNGKHTAMHTLAGGVSRFSTSRSSSTSTLARIPAVLDLSHQALDEGVLSLFGLNIELNREPDDMASLLWAIIHSDPQLTPNVGSDSIARTRKRSYGGIAGWVECSLI
jgi:hypothetical protein